MCLQCPMKALSQLIRRRRCKHTFASPFPITNSCYYNSKSDTDNTARKEETEVLVDESTTNDSDDAVRET